MKKVKVVKKVIVKEKKYVTPEAIQNEVSRILAVKAFNRWRDFFEMDDAMDDFEYCLEKFCESRCEGRWFSMGLVFAGLIDTGEMSFGRVLFYVADKNESFIDSFLEHFTACAAEELFFDDEEEEEEPEEEDHCRGCMGACFGDCECCRHMKAGADDE